MKVKQDFITNSSSTSFIIGDKEPYLTEFHARINFTVDLREFITERISTIEDLEQLEDYMRDGYMGNVHEKYVKCKKIIEKGGVVFLLNTSEQGDREMEPFLCHEGLDQSMLPDNLIIIQGEGENEND